MAFILAIGFSVVTVIVIAIVAHTQAKNAFKSLSDEEKKKVFDRIFLNDDSFEVEKYGYTAPHRLCKDLFSKEEKRCRVRDIIMKSEKIYFAAQEHADHWINIWAREVFTQTDWEIIKEEAKKKHLKRVLSRMWEKYDPPQFCPSCFSMNYERDDSGMKKNDQWILDSSEIKTKREFDSAYTIGGATTVFTKDKKETVKTYRCPKCGYKVTM